MKKAPRKIFEDYKDPLFLRSFGPIVQAAWRVPTPLESFLAQQAQPVPDKVSGWILIDTGAQDTCISLDVANQLGLRPVGLCTGFGAGGVHKNHVFSARLDIEMEEDGRKRIVTLEQRVQAIPNLNDFYKLSNAMRNGAPSTLIGLLGRDILRHGRLNYDGRGHITLEFFPDTLQKRGVLPGSAPPIPGKKP